MGMALMALLWAPGQHGDWGEGPGGSGVPTSTRGGRDGCIRFSLGLNLQKSAKRAADFIMVALTWEIETRVRGAGGVSGLERHMWVWGCWFARFGGMTHHLSIRFVLRFEPLAPPQRVAWQDLRGKLLAQRWTGGVPARDVTCSM